MAGNILAKFAQAGVSELISATGLIVGTSTVIGTLPENKITVGAVTLSLATGGNLYVGDRFELSASLDVSYGDVNDTNGKIKIEFIETGTGVINTISQSSETSREHVTATFKGVAISHGKKFYSVKVYVTGEDDIPWWPLDWADTKTGKSASIAIDVKKPLSFEFKLLTPSVNHGQKARALMKVTNHSEAKANVRARLDSSDPGIIRVAARATNIRAVDHKEAHKSSNHKDEQTYYFEKNVHYAHVHWVKVNSKTILYSQIRPSKETLFDPIPIQCKGTEKVAKVSYLPDPMGQKLEFGKYAYASVVLDEHDKPLDCSVMLADDYGLSIKGKTSAKGKFRLKGNLSGKVAALTIVPDSPLYDSYSARIPLDQEFLDSLAENRMLFGPSNLPVIRGVVALPSRLLAIAGAKVTLISATGKLLGDTYSDKEGAFQFIASKKDFAEGGATLKAKLPWNITYDWKNKTITQNIKRRDVISGDKLFVMKADIASEEEWNTIRGKVLLLDKASKNKVAVEGIQIVVRDLYGEVQDKATSNAKGQFSIGIKPGHYTVEVENAVEKGFEPVEGLQFLSRSSRAGANIKLRLPRPSVERLSSALLVWEGNFLKEDKLRIYDGKKVVKDLKQTNGRFYLKADAMKMQNRIRVALNRSNTVGPSAEVRFG